MIAAAEDLGRAQGRSCGQEECTGAIKLSGCQTSRQAGKQSINQSIYQAIKQVEILYHNNDATFWTHRPPYQSATNHDPSLNTFLLLQL
jgi:hypothetical protein